MTNYISTIAQIDKKDRFHAITKVLEDNDVTYTIQKLPHYNALGNIVVAFNCDNASKKTAVTAHYDNYYGTPGANDNAAACSILLNLILNVKKYGTNKPLEFVFFDLEESGFGGSQYYLQQNKDALLMVINLDMCGMGSNIVAAFHNGAEKFVSNVDASDIIVVKMLPQGDAYTFINAYVPTIYVINSTDHDLVWFVEYSKGKSPSGMPDFGRTIHQSGDTPDKCNIEQVNKIYEWINRILK